MISEWTVSLPKKLKGQVEHEVINQNINFQTAVIEALELWIKSPVPTKRSLQELDLDKETIIKADTDKQCMFVARSCLKDNCVGWIQETCLIHVLGYPTIKEMVKEKLLKEMETDWSEIIDENITLEDVHLDAILNNIETIIIQKALVKHKGSKTKAARLLNISFDSLRYRLEKLHLDGYGKKESEFLTDEQKKLMKVYKDSWKK